jgi:hypothetical protein
MITPKAAVNSATLNFTHSEPIAGEVERQP